MATERSLWMKYHKQWTEATVNVPQYKTMSQRTVWGYSSDGITNKGGTTEFKLTSFLFEIEDVSFFVWKEAIDTESMN